MGRARGSGSTVVDTRTRRVKPERVDDGRGLPLYPSAATPEQIQHSIRGFCHFIAAELHRRHGWQMRALGTPADEYSLSPWHELGLVRHIYCLRDDGLLVDGEGVFASEAAILRYYADQDDHEEKLVGVDISAEEIDNELGAQGYRRIYDVEVPVVRTLLDTLALDELGREQR